MFARGPLFLKKEKEGRKKKRGGTNCELLYANAMTRAREGPGAPRDSGRRLRQTRDREKIPKSSTTCGTACLRILRRGGSKAEPELGLSLRDIVGPGASAS